MSMKTTTKLAVLALAAGLSLAGCSNNSETGEMLKSLKGSFSLTGKKAAAAPAQKLDIRQVLNATDAPLTMITQKNLENTTVLILEIERNGPYRTYSTAGKQTLTFRQGLVTGTRGLGNDMMSAQVSESLALIKARREGTAKRVLRYLDGANNVIAFSFDCDMYITGGERVSQGVVSAQTTEMTENCVADTRKFTNTYLVDGTGTILKSQQWISPVQGYYDIQVLRR